MQRILYAFVVHLITLFSLLESSMRLALFAAAALCVPALAAHAATVYTYTGTNYTQAAAPFTTSERVTGTFTLATPLGANLNSATITPISFTFATGFDTFGAGLAYSSQFTFSTDASGNITNYLLSAQYPSPNSIYDVVRVDTYNGITLVSKQTSQATTQVRGTLTTNAAPTPTPITSVTPEPSSLALLGTGIVGVLGVMKRRIA